MRWLETKAPGLHRFLTRRDRPYPIVREILGVGLVLLLLVIILFGATGQPISGGYPVVVVTSGSMMHCKNATPDGTGPQTGAACDPVRFGRIGFVDPGDLVFVRKVHSQADVTTRAQAGASHYAMAGDVIVYHINGQTAGTPIIHRALFWVQVNGDGTYDIPELNITHASSLAQKEVMDLARCDLSGSPFVAGHPGAPTGPDASGFITRGDNNAAADQCPAGLRTGPVRVAWILGKARGEVPWLGLIKLRVDDWSGGSQNYRNAGSDSKAMLFVTIAGLVVVPWGVDVAIRRRRAKRARDPPQP